MSKTLYFEGAGCVPRGNVENCRIRTAFHNDDGRSMYLELTGMEVTKYNEKTYPHFKYVGHVDFCFYILNDDDENKHYVESMRHKTLEYTKAEILKLVNSLGCSFDEIVVLPDLAGYRVFRDDRGKGYNFGDDFDFDAERTARAEEIRRHFYELEKGEGKQYPNLSLWVDQENPELLHLLRHFSGYNKRWLIKNTENWQAAMREVHQGLNGAYHYQGGDL